MPPHQGETRPSTPPSITWQELSGREILRGELEALENSELRLLRNEIFARHGLIFQSRDLVDHFNAQPWHSGRVTDLNESDLMPVELHNLRTIQSIEKSRKN